MTSFAGFRSRSDSFCRRGRSARRCRHRAFRPGGHRRPRANTRHCFAARFADERQRRWSRGRHRARRSERSGNRVRHHGCVLGLHAQHRQRLSKCPRRRPPASSAAPARRSRSMPNRDGVSGANASDMGLAVSNGVLVSPDQAGNDALLIQAGNIASIVSGGTANLTGVVNAVAGTTGRDPEERRLHRCDRQSGRKSLRSRPVGRRTVPVPAERSGHQLRNRKPRCSSRSAPMTQST